MRTMQALPPQTPGVFSIPGQDLVLKRLDADTKPEDEWSALVLAALEGPDELAKLLDEGNALPFRAPSAVTGGEESAGVGPSAPSAPPSIAFLRTITVEGFRGIGPKATLDLTPGPGLTLVVGRNGSGKSSFAEGLELLLTGDTHRDSSQFTARRPGMLSSSRPRSLRCLPRRRPRWNDPSSPSPPRVRCRRTTPPCCATSRT